MHGLDHEHRLEILEARERRMTAAIEGLLNIVEKQADEVRKLRETVFHRDTPPARSLPSAPLPEGFTVNDGKNGADLWRRTLREVVWVNVVLRNGNVLDDKARLASTYDLDLWNHSYGGADIHIVGFKIVGPDNRPLEPR